MARKKERATGTAVAAVCGFLTGGFAISIGLLQYLVGVEFVPGTLLATVGYFVGGFVIVGVSMGVFTRRESARKLGIPVHVAAAAAFALMMLGNLDTTPTALVAAVMLGSNVIAAFSIVASKDVVVDGRTDTSDDHATDVGTGFH